MTYEEKLAAQEVLALPDRELLQATATVAFIDAAVAVGGAGGAGGILGPGGAGGDAAAAQTSDLEFGDAIAQQP